jgi:hypothetical protein
MHALLKAWWLICLPKPHKCRLVALGCEHLHFLAAGGRWSQWWMQLVCACQGLLVELFGRLAPMLLHLCLLGTAFSLCSLISLEFSVFFAPSQTASVFFLLRIGSPWSTNEYRKFGAAFLVGQWSNK